jgi:hypothetical protein
LEAGELDAGERAELERLRAEVAAYQRRGMAAGGRWARRGRWVGACALLIVAAMLSGLAVMAVYLRAELLDTETYVETVAPLAQDLAVREALATRLTDEIVAFTDIEGLATQLTNKLVEQGAPERIGELVGPAVSGLRSFLYNEIYKLLGTAQFQAIWEQVNRAAHDGLDAVLTGEEGRFIASEGTTVTLDVGALLSAAKQELVARGVDIASRVPDVSISYTLIESEKLPTLRRYTRILDGIATWLPFVALALLIAGVLVAPSRRRGIITGFVAMSIVAAGLLAALALGRAYYLDNLPPVVRSPDAAAAVIDTISRFLVASLQTLLVAAVVFVVVALLAGPSRPATAIRRHTNIILDAGGRGLARAGSWVAPIGRALHGARWAIQVGLVLAAIVGLILANRPGFAAVLWTTLIVLVLFAVIELFVRSPGAVGRATG